MNVYKIPAISVIIPTYNVERYIAQCLGSLMSQTFQDFEVIVIDDCSTDKTVKEIERMMSKFKGKLKLIKRKKNAGGPAEPRNQGINFSCGKYIFFLDGDDIIVNDAFEILYNAAENTNADVVHIEKNLLPIADDDKITSQTKFRLDTHQAPPFVDDIKLETDDIGDRIIRFCQKNFFWWACSKLFRREFLITNEIDFTNVLTTEDMIFTFKCLCLAKNYVRIPNVIYIYRKHENSITSSSISVEREVYRYAYSVMKGIKELDRFVNRIANDNEELKYKCTLAINLFIKVNIWCDEEIYSRVSMPMFIEMLNKSFAEEIKDGGEVFAGYCYNFLNMNMYQLKQSKLEINFLRQQIMELQRKIEMIKKTNTPPYLMLATSSYLYYLRRSS